MGQRWMTNSAGGYLANPDLSKEIRKVSQPLMRFVQFARPVKGGLGKHKGDSVLFDKRSNVATKGRVVSEIETAPKTEITIYRDSLTVLEYMNSIEFTGKLEVLSEFGVNSILGEALRDDEAKVRDEAARDQFRATDLVYIPTGTIMAPTYTLNVDGSLAAASRNLQGYDIKNINDIMSGYNIPTYDGDNYMCVATIKALRGIKDDSSHGGWIDASLYGKPENLWTGEIGEYMGVTFVKETNSLNNSLTGGLGEAIFFGADPVVYAVAIAPELRAKIPSDYGRDQGVAWYSLECWKVTWDFSSEGDVRILRVYSS